MHHPITIDPADYADRPVIIYAPQGRGKTRNSLTLAAYFGKSHIIDDFDPDYHRDKLHADTLALTNIQQEGALLYSDVIDAVHRQQCVGRSIDRFCVDCVFFKWHPGGRPTCMAPATLYMDPVMGPTPRECSKVRHQNDLCGPEARLFAPVPVPRAFSDEDRNSWRERVQEMMRLSGYINGGRSAPAAAAGSPRPPMPEPTGTSSSPATAHAAHSAIQEPQPGPLSADTDPAASPSLAPASPALFPST